MMTDYDTLRARIVHLDEMAAAYARALVIYHQTGDDVTPRKVAYHQLCDMQETLNRAAKAVADTI